MEKLTMLRAVELLGIEANTSRRSTNVPCPLCGKAREKKLNINFDKEVFRCAKCGFAGGPLHLWAVYRNLDASDLSLVSKDYYASTKSVQQPKVRKEKTVTRLDVETAPAEVRNKTYRGLLNMLSLCEEHKEKLLARGLSEKSVIENEYRSYPLSGYKNLAGMLLSQGYVLEGVPGFYKENGTWTLLKLPAGILIPQRDGFNRILGFQIRLDDSSKGKYITLSTGENYSSGAKASANPHFRHGSLGLSEIILTEGPLKGDVISYFTGYSVFAVQGVNSLGSSKSALSDLRDSGVKHILIAFDMDLKTNEHVKNALEKLKAVLAECGFTYSSLEWDPCYKGLDDWLLANKL